MAAFAASGLRRVWRAPATAWLVRTRRYIGLSFAVSHALHLAAILAVAATVPGFVADVSLTTAARRLGRRRWRALHLTGMWVVFGTFVSSYLGRATHNPNYWPHAALLSTMLVLRLLPTRAHVD